MNSPAPKSSAPPETLKPLLESLYNRINYERQISVTPKSFRLQNMREFLRRLGNPHLKYPIVHVAGTKGKGSVATMVGNILTTSGQRTGVYTSPHLESIHERMAIDGEPISDQQLIDCLQATGEVVREMDAEAERLGRRALTFFEVVTGTAFYFFDRQQADAVVLEVGLGGRMDSTNVCLPLVSVITSISLDHTRQLGTALESIAFEKAGIIKSGIQVISGAVQPAAAETIAEVAANNAAPLAVLGTDFFVTDGESTCDKNPDEMATTDFGVSGSLNEQPFCIDGLKLAMPGAHQKNNAALAVAAIHSLNRQGWQIDDAAIRDGLAGVRIPGRTELVSQHPGIIVDIAHNVDSARVLIDTLREMPLWRSSRRKTLIVSISQEKDASGMLQQFVGHFDRVVVTRYQNNPRAVPVAELHAIAAGLSGSAELIAAANPQLAWELVTHELAPDDFVCVAGSVFLVAEMRAVIRETVG